MNPDALVRRIAVVTNDKQKTYFSLGHNFYTFKYLRKRSAVDAKFSLYDTQAD